MKKLALFLCAFTLLLTSCSNDEDDVVPSCEIPGNLNATDITHNAATLDWSVAFEVLSFSIEYGVSGFERGTGTTVSSTDSTIDISNLAANTTYDFYVQTSCDATSVSLWSEVKSFTTLPELVVSQFMPNLSELNLFIGDLADLNPTIYAFEYELSTPLFSDYAHKHRIIALPLGTTMTYTDDGLPDFPEGTVIAKTFYYNNDERDLSLGRQIIETRILLKRNGLWETGDYKWNDDQTDAVLDGDGSTVPISWIDIDGETNNISYEIPSNTDCFTCHQTFGDVTPIGPKLRTLNFDIEGSNQLQKFIDSNYISGLTSATSVTSLPNWEDTSFTLEERARAYFDVQCAHCHIDGGFCQFQSPLRLAYETSFDDSNIFMQRFSIQFRVSNYEEGLSMPFIGTTILHDEGVDLMLEYIDSLD